MLDEMPGGSGAVTPVSVPSKLADASVRCSGVNASPRTGPVCPRSVSRSLPVFVAHSLIEPSQPADARVCPGHT